MVYYLNMLFWAKMPNMRKNWHLPVAYYLVTLSFTMLLLGTIFAVIAFAGFDSGLSVGEVEVQLSRYRTTVGKIEAIYEERGQSSGQAYIKPAFLDSVQVFTHPTTVSLALASFKRSGIVPFYFLHAKFILTLILWLVILYQVFLVLYDMKREKIFIPQNTTRIMKAGYCFLVLAAFNIFRHSFTGYVSEWKELVLERSQKHLFPENFIIYLITGFVLLAFSTIFQHAAGPKKQEVVI